jgi:hypothetical protein
MEGDADNCDAFNNNNNSIFIYYGANLIAPKPNTKLARVLRIKPDPQPWFLGRKRTIPAVRLPLVGEL